MCSLIMEVADTESPTGYGSDDDTRGGLDECHEISYEKGG